MKRLLVILIGAGGLCLWAFGPGWSPRATGQEQPGGKQPAEQEELGKLGPIEIPRGRIKLIDKVKLASDRPGIMEFVEPKEGDTVQADQQVAGLKDKVARATLAIAQKKAEDDVQIRYSKKAAEVAQADYESILAVNQRKEGTIPEIEVKKKRLEAERSILQIEKAEHDYVIAQLERDQAQARLETYQIKAPFDGVVTRVFKSKGEAVQQGAPILEVVNTDRVRVEGYIDLRDVWRVKQGDYVEVQLEIPEVELDVEKETFPGEITFVDVTVQPVAGKVRVKAEVENRENILRAGLNARVTIFPNKELSNEAKTAATDEAPTGP